MTEAATRPNVTLLFVTDVAKLRKISRSAARAWLASLEREHGARVVQRLGRKLCTTERALAAVLPDAGEHTLPSRRLNALESRIRRVAAHVHQLDRVVRDLRSEVLEVAAAARRATQARAP